MHIQKDICEAKIGEDLLFKMNYLQYYGAKCVVPLIVVDYSSDNVIIKIENIQIFLSDNNIVRYNVIIKKINDRWKHKIEEVKVNIFIIT